MITHHGDCIEVMTIMNSDSVHSVVTDPPYGLSFMGKHWDHGVPGEAFWREALRVAKPGAHLLAFGGTRTFHRLAVAIEDAGWEIRDTVMWVYGSGFPKSLDVSKAIDKAAGAEREVVGEKKHSPGWHKDHTQNDDAWRGDEDGGQSITAPATEAASKWNGWGTALKPAWEPVIVARKPLVGTVAGNVLEYGTGALNIDASRIPTEDKPAGSENNLGYHGNGRGTGVKTTPSKGRFPANICHDGSDEVVGLFPVTTSGGGNGMRSEVPNNCMSGKNYARKTTDGQPPSSGSAARFFYCAKASKADRDGSTHPTMKPTALMRYLCRLVTPPGGTVLDPFMGSGSTGKAAILEGFDFIGIEKEAEYIEIARARIAHAEVLRREEQSQLYLFEETTR